MTLASGSSSGAGLHVVDGVLIVPAPADFSDDSLRALGKAVLAAVHAASLRSVLLDVSRIELMDPEMFAVLARTARTAALLGARTVFVGFQPGVVSTLIDMDVDLGGVVSVATLEDGLDLLRRDRTDGETPEPGEEDDEQDGEDGECWPDDECLGCEDRPEDWPEDRPELEAEDRA